MLFRSRLARARLNPLLPPHLFVQALLLGSGVLLPIAAWIEQSRLSTRFTGAVAPTVVALLWTLAVTSLLHLLMIWGEGSLTHATAHARLAIWEMIHGRYKGDFWMGLAMSMLGAMLPALAVLGIVSTSIGVGGAPLALIGVMLYEHAYVQAGQSVPLA